MKIALVGNQNSGKTTLFNDLTGSNQKIGNWPGVTIERKEGILKTTEDFLVVDLPGIYSLSPYSPEEEVSRRFVIDEKPDLIINVVDSTSLERSLYLTTQLMELDSDVVLALNMSDILESQGFKIEINILSDMLGITVIPVSAAKETGIGELISCVKNHQYKKNNHIKIYPDDIEELIAKFSTEITCSNKRFSSVKFIEDDNGYHATIPDGGEELIKILETNNDMDGEQLIASRRYDFIEKVKKECVNQLFVKESITDKLDKIFLNKYLALPIFILIMGAIYFLSIGLVGTYTSPLIKTAFNNLGSWLGNLISQAGGSPWSISLVKNGIIGGIGSVLNFLPQIIVMFLCLSLLETTGYMSRIAFFLDRIFHKFGLSGKSLVPFIVGSGCSVPGVMSCRIIEDDNERKSTMILTPFIPCSAKLPIITLVSTLIFPKQGWVISLSLYLLAIILILLFGVLFKKLLFKGEHSTFISELPKYKAPKLKYVFRDVFDKTISFVKKAGTIILLFSLIVWFLSSFSWNMTFLKPEQIEQSILKDIGNAFAWFFYPMLGEWSWACSVSAIQGLIAKEQVVASMTIIAGGNDIFSSAAFSFMASNPVSAYAFCVFNLFSIPCIATVSSIKKESGNFKTLLFTLGFEICISWILATLIGTIGRGILVLCQ